MILLIDNYDSFSYNLYQMIGTYHSAISVVRNDKITVEEIEAMAPTHIFLSPGPGKPSDAGICEAVVEKLGGKIPIMGVCLGHQAICEVYGATVTYAPRMMHGKTSMAQLRTDTTLFAGMEEKVQVARYHSLVAKKDTIPDTLMVTAVTADGEVMAVQHKEYPVFGVQFHPESIMTPQGGRMVQNFLKVSV